MAEVIRIEVADKVVTMPVDKKTLGEFISGLLGQPQTLERRIHTAFSIDHAWLIHFCSLITQRINQQNSHEPLSFEAVIFYGDGIKRVITSFSAFEHFAETQNFICKGVKISISLLIQFPGKLVPERQDLVFEFETRTASGGFLEIFLGIKESTGVVDIEIRHTERTWADDLFRLILDEVEAISVVDKGVKEWLRRKVFPLYSLFFPFFMFFMLGFGAWDKQRNADLLKSKLDALIGGKQVGLTQLHEKMNILVNYTYANDGQQFGHVAIFVICCMTAIFVFYLAIQLARPSPSFVVLSKATERYRDKTLKKLQRKNIMFIGSIVLTIILGLTVNFLYDMVK